MPAFKGKNQEIYFGIFKIIFILSLLNTVFWYFYKGK